MILTINYADLQDIKNQILNNNKIADKEIYLNISNFKDTLDNMYKQKLVADKSKTDYEYELMTFAKELLSRTNKSYYELKNEYKLKTTADYYISVGGIRLIL